MSLRDDVLRYLRQRADLGERELFLDSITANELRRLLHEAGQGGDAVATAPPTTASTATMVREPAPAGAPEREAGPAGPKREAGRPTPPADLMPSADRAGALRQVAQEALGCTRCRLSEGRSNVVFGDGTVDAEVVVVGEAPGAEEDRTGVPFVGRAGRMLDLMLMSVGLPRERVYICNVLKCRPPGNRDPMADEVACCTPFLKRQIELIQPRVLLAVGRFAAQMLVGSEAPLGRLRGRVHAYEGVPVVVSYHPAYLLRSPDQVRKAWDDLQLLRSVVGDGD